MKLRRTMNQYGVETFHLDIDAKDRTVAELNMIEESVVDAANPALISDSLIGLAMFAKAAERAYLKEQREKGQS